MTDLEEVKVIFADSVAELAEAYKNEFDLIESAMEFGEAVIDLLLVAGEPDFKGK